MVASWCTVLFFCRDFLSSMLISSKAADDSDRVRVKICGLTREDDVVTAVDAGADAVGFVCYPQSSRYVTPSRLMALTSLVPSSVTVVLVFVNPTSEEVREHVSLFPKAVLQFHGNESRAFCDQFGVPYIKAVAVKTGLDILNVQEEYPMAHALLADTDDPQHGGVGEAFDWPTLAAVRDRITKPLIVAGGLNTGNVAQAIDLLRPWAVDVASGVEAAKGVKDHDKLLGFMDAVEACGQVQNCAVD